MNVCGVSLNAWFKRSIVWKMIYTTVYHKYMKVQLYRYTITTTSRLQHYFIYYTNLLFILIYYCTLLELLPGSSVLTGFCNPAFINIVTGFLLSTTFAEDLSQSAVFVCLVQPRKCLVGATYPPSLTITRHYRLMTSSRTGFSLYIQGRFLKGFHL